MKKIISVLLILAMACSMVCVASAAEDELFATVNVKQFDEGKEPNIDGSVSNAEWGQPVSAMKYDGSNTYSWSQYLKPAMEFEIWMGYTFDGLYLAVRNRDDAHSNPNLPSDPKKMYNGDCIQLRIDEMGCTVDQGMTPSATRKDNWSTHCTEFGFGMAASGEAFTYRWEYLGDRTGSVIESGKTRISHSGGYTTYEIYIPWDEIVEMAPHVDSKFGMTIGMMNFTGSNPVNMGEWGSGEFNGRNENICGSNRIVFTNETVFGGPSLVDPHADETTEAIVPPPVAEGDYVNFDLAKFSDPFNMSFIENSTNASVELFYSGDDPSIKYNVSRLAQASADEYKYLAIYCSTNTYDHDGRLYFSTTTYPQESQENSESFSFSKFTDENQVAVVDLTGNLNWTGTIGMLRFDIIDPAAETEVEWTDMKTEVFGIALFKTYEDALSFNVEGFDVTDPIDSDTDDETTAPTEDTTVAGDTDTTVEDTTVVDTTDASTTTAADTTDGDEGSNIGLIIAIVIAVVVVAGGVAAFVIIKKKKQ